MPAGLLELVESHPGEISSIQPDALGRKWLFVSTADLTADDANGLSDVYLYDTQGDFIEAVSLTLELVTGTGASTSPGMDDLGRFAVFASSADDLTLDDGNGVNDVFVRDLDFATTHRISTRPLAEAFPLPAGNPAIDGEGVEILYDQQNAAGLQQIFSRWPGAAPNIIAYPANGETMDAPPLRQHHPSLSADGRFVVFLRTDEIPWERTCSLVLIDRWNDQSEQLHCPESTDTGANLYPTISRDGALILWHLDSVPYPVANDAIYAIANPLFAQ